MASRNINGIQLELFADGNGEPLVLVHGSASDYRTWDCQREEFARKYHVITYSRRYHWPNDPIHEAEDYSMSQHVDDLQALLHWFNGRSVHIVGHSYGAFLGLLLAIREPALVRTLVLAEPPVITLFVSSQPKPLELLRLLLIRPRTAAAIIKLGAQGLGPAAAAVKQDDMEEAMRLFGTAILGHDAYHGLSEERKEQVRLNLIKAEFLGSGFSSLTARQLRDIQVPTLLLNGESSPSVFHCLTNRLEELLPHSERREIPAASHMMHEDNAAAFNTAVLEFLTKHEQRI